MCDERLAPGSFVAIAFHSITPKSAIHASQAKVYALLSLGCFCDTLLSMSGTECSVRGCTKPKKAKGVCMSHYHLKRRYGTTTHKGTPRNKATNFFNSAISYKGNACLEWPYGCNGKGYPHVSVNGRQQPANIVMCTIVRGDKPTDKPHAAHLCGNKKCINPRHLKWCTIQENNDHKKIHGTTAMGESHGMSVLSEQDVLDIRKSYQSSRSQRSLARQYGVSQAQIYRIVHRKSWKHI